jgi:NTE family protein
VTRALVLGGGGPVGIGWESGLVVGLAGEGIRLADADMIVGTSAGSVVGSQMALGLDLAEAVTAVRAPLPLGAGGDAGIAGLMNAMAESATGEGSPEQSRIVLGRLALEAETVGEDLYLGAFDLVRGVAWPDGYACTAVDVHTGAFQVWDSSTDADLQHAIASSCSVPGVFPPVTVGANRYMDGGMRTPLNADVAIGHDVVVAVSCFILALPEGMSDPTFEALSAQTEAEFAAVRASGATLEVIAPGPEFLEVSGWGLNLMDPSLVQAAYESGVTQAAVEAQRLRAAWKP